ncbi:MAG: tryptophan--tRNA ligase [Saprospiraceae bacterium]|nr:tryptophan--tRNA ligase [Saprospiraceae bacterium]MBK6476998.1 tryptophan--tRNA ligase [Saprospiraceae bacterium]MBK7370094.1 tryptophan--tRNA ligase [Saprospiraceae bacterium]MBK9678947.1 tryptophan--tRNA ligase [Saprospiraceae bacterium]MBK9930758.1 tryptophan--tRNA ligase [Saprospiraceae bacterium]
MLEAPLDSSATRPRVLSCMQPTGNLHFGRYFGAVQNWVNLQQTYNCFYGIVDYHAMTMPYKPSGLREATWNGIFGLLACGINPDNLFIQSLVPEHAELAWILNCFASYGETQRMTQFKDKTSQASEKDKDAFISVGLFTYPVLQAADILIYKPKYVPVGKDQEQHLELARNIATRLNNIVGKELIPVPEALFTEIPKVMSTADPSRKMSASLGEKHNINVFAPAEVIRKQIKSAVTDTGTPDPGKMSEGVENLFSLLRACGQQEAAKQLLSQYTAQTLKYSELKEVVADALVALSDPMRDKMQEILANKKDYKQMIKASSVVIRKQAKANLDEIKEAVGLMVV